ncbi:MAG: hypothetical protein H6819_06700 [Phycisphaerales bacterium]|nr:hypothetical protein [Phycisphaerales bacterium]MCB9855270.1 hypothetical protein [Phycisphaerales bacterium]MCB9862863.1 hypothetical protein [Phycisphaerales bacterium]
MNDDSKSKPSASTKAAAPDPAGERLTVPMGDVLLRYIKGPPEGVNHIVGKVRTGSIHTVTLEEAAYLCLREAPQFEPAYPDDRARIEEASRLAKDAAERARAAAGK